MSAESCWLSLFSPLARSSMVTLHCHLESFTMWTLSDHTVWNFLSDTLPTATSSSDSLTAAKTLIFATLCSTLKLFCIFPLSHLRPQCKAQNDVIRADVPLRNSSLTHSRYFPTGIHKDTFYRNCIHHRGTYKV